MKTKTRILTLLALGALAATPALRAADKDPSQDRPRMAEMREQRMKQLEETLHLTPEQKTRITEIWAKAAQQARADRDAARDATKSRREHRREMMKATHDQVRAVLTPEQQKIFDELPPPRGARGPRRGGDGAP